MTSLCDALYPVLRMGLAAFLSGIGVGAMFGVLIGLRSAGGAGEAGWLR